jgi:hypothetical protein
MADSRRWTLVRNGDEWRVTTSGRELFDADEAVEVMEALPMPNGERVTTGSEPRRTWRLAAAYGAGSLGNTITRIVAHGPRLGPNEMVEVVEVVEPGHDEQTEACSVCGGRGWHTAGGNDPAACGACPAGEAWYGGDEWQPDPRTVAAVVELMDRERENYLASRGLAKYPTQHQRTQAATVDALTTKIVEHFREPREA